MKRDKKMEQDQGAPALLGAFLVMGSHLRQGRSGRL